MQGATVTNVGQNWTKNEEKRQPVKGTIWLRNTSHRRDVWSERVSERPITAQPRKSWRYSVGLTLQASRKTCAKCCWVLKPQATATSNTRASAARNIAFARSSLWRRTN